MSRLDGKVALVTGARGIGAAIARAMVAEGAGLIRQFIAPAKEPIKQPVNAGR